MGTWYVTGISYSSDELYHHGIKGQKWGVRRFQNLDGTRTAAGKERYKSNSKETASWIHEASGGASIDRSRQERMLNAIRGALDEGRDAVSKSAKRNSKAFKEWQDSEEAANKVWSDTKKLRQKYAERVPKIEIKQMENKYGEKYTGVDGPTTVDEYVKDRARYLFDSSNEPVAQAANRNYQVYKKAYETLEKDCKKFANSYFEKYEGLDSAVSKKDGSIKTVSEVFAKYLTSRVSQEEIDKLYK